MKDLGRRAINWNREAQRNTDRTFISVIAHTKVSSGGVSLLRATGRKISTTEMGLINWFAMWI